MRPGTILILAFAGSGAAFAAEEPDLRQILARAGAYVEQFESQLSGIVAEEHYIQEVRYAGRRPRAITNNDAVRRRRLLSDLLLVKPDGARDWMQFRDVYEVDGAAVRDRDERLSRLFLSPTESVSSHVAAIAQESARYNLGAVNRTMNTPVIALLYLEPRYQSRFKFKRTGDRMPNGIVWVAPAPRAGHFDPPKDAFVVSYSEQQKGTMIRTTNGRDIFARGRFWVEPSTGRVLMSEMVLEDSYIRATVIVNYQSQPILGLLVPTEMRERYDQMADASLIDGYATYGRFRQFQVNVDEKLGPIRK